MITLSPSVPQIFSSSLSFLSSSSRFLSLQFSFHFLDYRSLILTRSLSRSLASLTLDSFTWIHSKFEIRHLRDLYAILAHRNNLTHLNSLDCSGVAASLTSDQLILLVTEFRSLHSLNLSNCSLIIDRAIEFLCSLVR